uniref:Uncharacterized protein n=1 Tax=Oryza barthii TaxID=65489 RepID=A0A0D3ELL4_9ORYZ
MSLGAVEKGKGKLVPLRPPSGRRCKTCADVLVAAESALFCTFQCKARSGEVAGHRWAQDLLLDDFAVPCERFDRVCWVYPPKSFCGLCCGSHHSCAPGTFGSKNSRFTTGRVIDSDGRTVIRHVSDPDGGRCRGVCTICKGDVASADHAGFSSAVCGHHHGHTWLRVCLHGGHHGGLILDT